MDPAKSEVVEPEVVEPEVVEPGVVEPGVVETEVVETEVVETEVVETEVVDLETISRTNVIDNIRETCEDSDDGEDGEPLVADYELGSIHHTVYIQMIDQTPNCVSKMHALVKILDNLHMTQDFNLDTVLSMSPRRLDCFYIVMKMVNLMGVQYCEDITHDIIIPMLQNYLFSDNMVSNYSDDIDINVLDAFVEELNCDMATFIIGFLSRYINVFKLEGNELENKIDHLTNRLKTFLYKLCNSDYYKPILKAIGVHISIINMNYHIEDFRIAVRQIIDETRKSYLSYRSSLSTLISKIFDPTCDETTIYNQVHKHNDIGRIISVELDAVQY